MRYITIPIEVDAEDVLQDAITYLQSKFPGWQPNPTALDTALLTAWATEVAQLRELASQVPDTIYRYFGASLVQIPPVDASPATATTTWTMINNLGYTIPAGTQVSLPTSTGDRVAFETVVDVVVPPGSTVATPVTIVAIEDGVASSGLGSIGGAVQLEDPLAFVTFVTQLVVTTSGVDAEDDDTYLTRLRQELTLLSPRLIVPSDFAIDSQQVPGVWRSLALDGYNPFHNLLTANQASAETDASGWSNIANATVASSSAQAADGTKSVSLTATAADMQAATPVAFVGAGAIAVSPGDVITGLVSMRAATTVRSCKAQLFWSDAAGASLGSATGVAANDSNSAWTQYSVTAVAPTNAAFVRVAAYVTAPAVGEVHYVDKASLRKGTTTDWVPGGTPAAGNARMIAIASVDINGNAVSSDTKAAIDARAQAGREATFIVNVIDPNFTAIDVTFTVASQAGVNTADLQTRAQAAVAAFLSPATWGQDEGSTGDVSARTWDPNNNVVRYLDVTTVIRNVSGVDHITSCTIGLHGGTMGTTDITLPGPAPLATPGTIIGAAT